MDLRKFYITIFFCFVSTDFLYVQQNDENKHIDVVLEDTQYFPGKVSLVPEEIYLALKHCAYLEKIKILEFGAGESTVQLTKLLEKKNIPFEYHVFENDKDYIQNVKGVAYHYYYLPGKDIEDAYQWNDYVAQYDLPQLPVFDLIIVDGPHGVSRALWYEKFKKYTKPGTVILIDDFHHFKEFGQALDANYEYLTIVEYNQCPTWKIVNEGLDPLSNYSINKTFKVVKVIK
jgi:hypothetical protein